VGMQRLLAPFYPFVLGDSSPWLAERHLEEVLLSKSTLDPTVVLDLDTCPPPPPKDENGNRLIVTRYIPPPPKKTINESYYDSRVVHIDTCTSPNENAPTHLAGKQYNTIHDGGTSLRNLRVALACEPRWLIPYSLASYPSYPLGD
jgi:hypothetical protein